jgi:uncharacterized membrane protein
MLHRTKYSRLVLSLIIGVMFLTTYASSDANGVTLYTPYTKISVPPGESIDYSVDVINNSSVLQKVDISVVGIPKGWNYTLKSGGWTVGQIAILPGERKNFSLKIDVPLKVDKGDYKFRVLAGPYSTLALVINVSKQGTFKTEFTTDQANMQGHSKSTFTFNGNLKNRTGEKQLYSLRANVPQGWEVVFKANYKQATSVEIEPNNNATITIEVNPPDQLEARTYKIPVSASTNNTSAALDLEVVITGSYNMELTTPTGLLSTSITAGDDKRVELLVRNTGSSPLTNIKFNASSPVNWSVSFEPKEVARLEPGASTTVYATIKADKKAIPGDYVTNIDANTTEVSSKASFRISVKTPMLWGWFGILIIIAALGGVYYLFRKYGRR